MAQPTGTCTSPPRVAASSSSGSPSFPLTPPKTLSDLFLELKKSPPAKSESITLESVIRLTNSILQKVDHTYSLEKLNEHEKAYFSFLILKDQHLRLRKEFLKSPSVHAAAAERDTALLMIEACKEGTVQGKSLDAFLQGWG
jgi:hypothetical protein